MGYRCGASDWAPQVRTETCRSGRMEQSFTALSLLYALPWISSGLSVSRAVNRAPFSNAKCTLKPSTKTDPLWRNDITIRGERLRETLGLLAACRRHAPPWLEQPHSQSPKQDNKQSRSGSYSGGLRPCLGNNIMSLV